MMIAKLIARLINKNVANNIFSNENLNSILSLFSAGEQGAWYDPSDFSTMFQNAAGTIPVTAVGQAVGRILDKSGRGNHATQTTDTKRPVLSAKYNILKSTTIVGAWVTTNVTATGNQSGYNSSNTAISLYETAVNGRHGIDQVGLGTWQIGASGISYKIRIKSLGAPWCNITFGASGATNYPDIGCFFNLNTGAIGTVQSPTVNTQTVNNLGNGWWEVVINSSISGSYSLYAAVKCASANNVNSYLGNPSVGILIDTPELRLNNEAIGIPSYQRINTVNDYDTTGFPPYLLFDGIDDALQTASVNFTGTDKVTVWAGVRKLSDAGSLIFIELSPNINNESNAFALLAPSVSGSYRFFSRGSGSSSGAGSGIFAPAPNTSVLTCIGDISGAVVQLRRNGSVVETNNADQGTGNYGNYPLYIGSSGGISQPFNGRLYSLIIRGAQSTATQISNAETYVNSKTGAY